MGDGIRIIKHEVVPDCGSFGPLSARSAQPVFLLGRHPARRMRPETFDRETALEKAKAVAKAIQDPK